MLYFSGAGDYDTDLSGVYIMHNKIIPLMRLENPDEQYGQMNSAIYARWNDSSGAYRVHYRIVKLPDVNDNQPYNPPAPGTVMIPGGYNNGAYSRPAGLIDAASSSLEKNREVVFKSGWKVLIRERADTGEKSFAPGFAPPIWPNPQHTEFIFVDPQGEPKYFYENTRLYKIMY